MQPVLNAVLIETFVFPSSTRFVSREIQKHFVQKLVIVKLGTQKVVIIRAAIANVRAV